MRLFSLTGDVWLLFVTRSLRMFAYGFLSVVLVLYLKAVGLKEEQIGFLLTITLLGDVAISLWITTAADRFGRKRMLILGAMLLIRFCISQMDVPTRQSYTMALVHPDE